MKVSGGFHRQEGCVYLDDGKRWGASRLIRSADTSTQCHCKGHWRAEGAKSGLQEGAGACGAFSVDPNLISMVTVPR